MSTPRTRQPLLLTSRHIHQSDVDMEMRGCNSGPFRSLTQLPSKWLALGTGFPLTRSGRSSQQPICVAVVFTGPMDNGEIKQL